MRVNLRHVLIEQPLAFPGPTGAGHLSGGAQGLGNVVESGFLGVADANAAEAEEASLGSRLRHILTDAAKPRLEGSRVGGSFRIEDFRHLPQVSERALNAVGRLCAGKAILQGLLRPLGSAADTAIPTSIVLCSTFVHSSGVKFCLLAIADSHGVSLSVCVHRHHAGHRRDGSAVGPDLRTEARLPGSTASCA